MKTNNIKRAVYGVVLTLICTILFVIASAAAIKAAKQETADSVAVCMQETEQNV